MIRSTVTTCAMVCVLLQAGLAMGQDRTAGERALIDRIATCHDAWVASIAQKDFTVFATACPLEPDGLYWYVGAAAEPTKYSATEGPWAGSVANEGRMAWRSLEPVAVQIHADVALVHYTVIWTHEALDGQATDYPSRRLTVFRRVDGDWVQIGGSIAPVPPAP